MFEGGKGSRKDSVSRVAKAYEKTQKSLYMSVIEQTVEGAEQKLSQGIKPDLISFSPGLDGVEGIAKRLPLSEVLEVCKMSEATFYRKLREYRLLPQK